MTDTRETRDLPIDPGFALLVITDQKHYHITRQTHDPITAGHVLHLTSVHNSGHIHHLRHALCTLTLTIDITIEDVVIQGHALSPGAEEYFAVGYGFDTITLCRAHFLNQANPYRGHLIFWS